MGRDGNIVSDIAAAILYAVLAMLISMWMLIVP